MTPITEVTWVVTLTESDREMYFSTSQHTYGSAMKVTSLDYLDSGLVIVFPKDQDGGKNSWFVPWWRIKQITSREKEIRAY